MNVIGTSPGMLVVQIDRDELEMLNNALNEVCNGMPLADDAFQARIGWDKGEMRALLAQVSGTLADFN